MGMSALCPSVTAKPAICTLVIAGNVFAAAGMLVGSFQCQVASETLPTVGAMLQCNLSTLNRGSPLPSVTVVQPLPFLACKVMTVCESTLSLNMGATSMLCTTGV